MAKAVNKKLYHKQDMDRINKTALMIGGILAVAILIVIVVSFVWK